MIGLLDELAQIATDYGVYILLIHHDGHNPDRQGHAIDGVRGASGIRDVPQTMIAISRVSNKPRLRRIRVAGNEVEKRESIFEVSRPDEPEGQINRFEPLDEGALDLDHIFARGPVTLSEFGRRALSWATDRAPSGGAKNKARKLLESLESRGLVRKEGSQWHHIDE